MERRLKKEEGKRPLMGPPHIHAQKREEKEKPPMEKKLKSALMKGDFRNFSLLPIEKNRRERNKPSVHHFTERKFFFFSFSEMRQRMWRSKTPDPHFPFLFLSPQTLLPFSSPPKSGNLQSDRHKTFPFSYGFTLFPSFFGKILFLKLNIFFNTVIFLF